MIRIKQNIYDQLQDSRFIYFAHKNILITFLNSFLNIDSVIDILSSKCIYIIYNGNVIYKK